MTAQAVAGRQRRTVVASVVVNEGHHRATATAMGTMAVHGDVPAPHGHRPGQQEAIEVELPNARFRDTKCFLNGSIVISAHLFCPDFSTLRDIAILESQPFVFFQN